MNFNKIFFSLFFLSGIVFAYGVTIDLSKLPIEANGMPYSLASASCNYSLNVTVNGTNASTGVYDVWKESFSGNNVKGGVFKVNPQNYLMTWNWLNYDYDKNVVGSLQCSFETKCLTCKKSIPFNIVIVGKDYMVLTVDIQPNYLGWTSGFLSGSVGDGYFKLKTPVAVTMPPILFDCKKRYTRSIPFYCRGEYAEKSAKSESVKPKWQCIAWSDGKGNVRQLKS